jgi:two-component system CheB/CheR fusion protein
MTESNKDLLPATENSAKNNEPLVEQAETITDLAIDDDPELTEQSAVIADEASLIGIDNDGDSPSHVIAIGASAGGLEALERFFRAMPSDSGMSFVVIQHLSPDFKSLMDELLERFNRMPVKVVRDTAIIKANHIYLLQPSKELTIHGKKLVSRERSREGSLFLPINIFFRSLAATWGEKSVAIVLSGTGSDGSHGALDIRDAGGLVIAESPETARFNGMPQSLINTGCADAILPPEEIPSFLMKFSSNPEWAREFETAPTPNSKLTGLPAILELLRKTFRIDFNHYKPGTITRRIERRQAFNLHGSNCTLEEYTHQLENDPEALNLLYKDLLIGVTRFFRDIEAFDVLREKVIPSIVESVSNEEEIRVWVCGCSTGEEAYSIAILFMEEIQKQGKQNILKVLATDLHEESLQTAAIGIYDEESLSDVPDKILKKFFESLGEGRYKVLSNLRKSLIFSRHNLLNDPPFTHIHLVSCRNLLIYLKQPAQARAIASFHYSLVLNGVMFLGASESLGELTDEFEIMDRHWKLFKKIRVSRILNNLKTPASDFIRRTIPTNSVSGFPLQKLYDSVLASLIPNGYLVNDQQELIHLFGNAKRYIDHETGRFSGSLNSAICKDLQLPLVSAMRNAAKQMSPVVLHNLRVQLPNSKEVEQLLIKVIPLIPKTGDAPFFLIHLDAETELSPFIDLTQSSLEKKDFNIQSDVKDYVRDWELELQRTRETLQSTVEELETSNEELQASNEELLASNEELQSTNEELHSVNEELYSVNAEHELKIDELNRISTDLRNLIQSTDTATIFVDTQRRIRLFTPKARDIFSLMPQDMGRELNHFKPTIPDELLISDINKVIADGNAIGRYIGLDMDRSFLRRCSPMQDEAGKFSGVVINYTDTTEVTRGNRALNESEARFELILQTTPNGILVLDENDTVVIANRSAESLFGGSPDSLLGMSIEKLLVDYEQINPAKLEGQDYKLRRFDGKSIMVELSRNSFNLDGKPYSVLMLVDVTSRCESEQAGLKAMQAAQELAQARSFFLANMSHEIRTPLATILGAATIGAMPKHKDNYEKMLDCFHKVTNSGEHLLNIINDVLDFSKIDAGVLPLNRIPLSLNPVLKQCVAEIQQGLTSNGLQLELILAEPDRQFLCDTLRLKQIIFNLLSNAIKFTPKGWVRLRGHFDSEWVIIEVADSGIGIAQSDIERIFKPFEQADNSMTRAYGGTGLGLAIINSLLEKMEGHLEISSQPNEGSLFTVKLPFIPSDASEENTNRSVQNLQGLKIILVEDEIHNLDIIQELIESLEATVTTFTNGLAVLEYIQDQGDQCPADLILMDLEMPIMNGYQAAEAILKIKPDLPIIALTAHAFAEASDKAHELGMLGHITKPISIENMVETITKVISSNSK